MGIITTGSKPRLNQGESSKNSKSKPDQEPRSYPKPQKDSRTKEPVKR